MFQWWSNITNSLRHKHSIKYRVKHVWDWANCWVAPVKGNMGKQPGDIFVNGVKIGQAGDTLEITMQRKHVRCVHCKMEVSVDIAELDTKWNSDEYTTVCPRTKWFGLNNKILYLDDMRTPPDVKNLTLVKNIGEATAALVTNDGEPFHYWSLDHDLGIRNGKEETGYDFLMHIAEHWPEYLPQQIIIHSSNPVGVRRIIAAAVDLGIPAIQGSIQKEKEDESNGVSDQREN